MRAIIRILCVLGLTLFCVACGGGGGGGNAPPVSTVPPPPPPPTALPPIACTGPDIFPDFLYGVEETATSPQEVRLASSDGCRTELVIIGSGVSAAHMTADGSQGVILWNEDIDNVNQDIVWRLDFTVDNSGVLAVGMPVTVLPLAGQEALPGDHLFLGSLDIWGDATHDSLYVALERFDGFNSGPNAGTGTKVALIYDLNDLTDVTSSPDVREIYNQDAGGWQDAIGLDCSSVPYPQFVPTCYAIEGLRFNPSGTRLYLEHHINDPDGENWDATMRIHIDRGGGPALTDWTLTGPELIFAGTTGHSAGGALPRPNDDPLQLPSPEFVAIRHLDGSGTLPYLGSFLDSDQCAADYAVYTGGTLEAPFDLWLGCLNTDLFIPGAGSSWQSPDALLKGVGPHLYIYRVYVAGALAGTEQLLIELTSSSDGGN